MVIDRNVYNGCTCCYNMLQCVCVCVCVCVCARAHAHVCVCICVYVCVGIIFACVFVIQDGGYCPSICLFILQSL